MPSEPLPSSAALSSGPRLGPRGEAQLAAVQAYRTQRQAGRSAEALVELEWAACTSDHRARQRSEAAKYEAFTLAQSWAP